MDKNIHMSNGGESYTSEGQKKNPSKSVMSPQNLIGCPFGEEK
jgi:hypothetical protein